MTDPVTGAAVAKLALELGKLGYKAWKSDAKAKAHLVGILMHVQDELNRNYTSLRNCYNASTNERLEKAAYDAGWDAIFAALDDSSAGLLDAIRTAYQAITRGTEDRMARPLTENRDAAEIAHVWRLTGRASYEIDRWLEDAGVGSGKLSETDCKYRTLGELLGGWPKDEQLSVHKKWRDFVAALKIRKAYRYRLDEFATVTMYERPDQEVEFRADAREKWDWLHSFEVQDGIHELWISAGTRILFGGTESAPVLLDIVELIGRDDESWCPKRYVRRARCRLETRQRGAPRA